MTKAKPLIDEADLDAQERTRHKRQAYTLGFIVLMIFSVGFFLQYVSSRAPAVPPDIPPAQTTQPEVQTPEPAPLVISFGEYFRDRTAYNNKHLTISGLLVHSVDNGVHAYGLIDDEGNRINLKGVTREQQKLFVPESVTTSLFAVTGTLKRTYAGFDMTVEGIAAD